MPSKIKSGLGAHQQANQAPSWMDIGNQVTADLLRDLQASAKVLPQDAPVRRFLAYLLLSASPTSIEVVSIYNQASWTSFTPQVAAMKVAAAIDEYILAHRGLFKKDWSRRAQALISQFFIALGELPGKRYPLFDHGLLPVRTGTPSPAGKSLGALDWPELKGIRPGQRDEEALELVQAEILTILEESELAFAYGQTILAASSPPRNVNEECWWSVKRYLEALKARLEDGKLLSDVSVEGVNLMTTWIYAGFPKSISGSEFLEAYSVREFASRCLGATNRVTAAVKLLMCTVTGWNKTQIGLVPRDPYAFRYEDEFGLCQAAFMAVFKARAGHFVHVHLDRGSSVIKLSREQNQSFWDETEKELNDDNQARIVNSPSAMDVFDRYTKLTEPLRSFDVDGQFADYFFVSIGQKGLSDTGLNLREYKLSAILNRDGVSYRAARQSFVNIVRRTTGSLAMSTHLTNNVGTGVILNHYDDPEIQAELDAVVAFWQNCFQALMLPGQTSLRSYLAISDDDLEWFRNLAVAAGIASSLRVMGRKLLVSEREFLVLERSPEAFQEVYLIKLGLLAARARIGQQRWRMQGVVMRGYIIAMRQHILEAGLIDEYFDAVRSAIRRLRKGEIALPVVMDD